MLVLQRALRNLISYGAGLHIRHMSKAASAAFFALSSVAFATRRLWRDRLKTHDLSAESAEQQSLGRKPQEK
jgi:hypothetical protein